MIPNIVGVLGILLLTSASLRAQEFRITSTMLGPGNKLLFEFQSDTNSYYILLRGEALTNITTPMALTLGTSDSAQLTDNTPISAAWTFFRVLRVPLTQ